MASFALFIAIRYWLSIDGNSAAATNKMHDFQPVAFFEVRITPAIARNDFSVQFDRNAVGLHAEDFNKSRKCQ
jgi:hypothetical protein